MKSEMHPHGKTFYYKSLFVGKYSERASHVINNKTNLVNLKKIIFIFHWSLHLQSSLSKTMKNALKHSTLSF